MLLTKLKTLLGIVNQDEDDLLLLYIDLANDAVLKRLYPFGNLEEATVPPEYDSYVLRIAEYLYLRRGSEGETTHTENGVTRAYESGAIPNSMLKDIVPFVGGFTVEKS